MSWKFDPKSLDIVFVVDITEISSGSIDLGTGDLSIDTGLRENDDSTLDQGERI